jgi:hypothetical protein
VTGSTAPGYITLYPDGTPLPLASHLNYSAGQTRANNAIVSLGPAGDLAVYCALGSTDLIIDVTGYFE